MVTSSLGRLMKQFEEERAALSLPELAGRLDLSLGQVESMLDFWVRKGRLREVRDDKVQCSSCYEFSVCPFIIESPRYYELVLKGKDSLVKQDSPINIRCE